MSEGMQNVIRATEQESAQCKVSEKELRFEDCWERFQNAAERVEWAFFSSNIYQNKEFEKETRALLKDSKENLEIHNRERKEECLRKEHIIDQILCKTLAKLSTEPEARPRWWETPRVKSGAGSRAEDGEQS